VGVRNYLVEGGSGTGKTAVAEELQRRGYDVVHGDRVLAYQGDPVSGEPTPGASCEHHVWDVAKVRALVADRRAPVTFFCGGSRNFASFLDLLDGVVVLDVDLDTALRRIEERVRVDPTDFGARPEERAEVVRMHRAPGTVPDGWVVDASPPVGEVVDEILRRVEAER